jgi:hypothetical protein
LWPLPGRVFVGSVVGVRVPGEDAIEVMRRAARAAAVAAAATLAAVVAVAEGAERGYDADEVAFALVWTPGQARAQVEFGKYLIHVLPVVFAAFAMGGIDARRAWTFYDALATTDDTLATTDDTLAGACPRFCG